MVAVQPAPLAPLSRHMPPEQYLPLWQLVSTVQVAGHAFEPPPQTRGAQAGAPAEPALRKVQVPTVPARLQASQAPPQAEVQQKPSTQLPLWQSVGRVQEPPIPFWPTQLGAMQNAPAAHWAPVAHVVPQELPPPQMYGAQLLIWVPASSVVQVPCLPARLQASQALPHPKLQQNPPVQLPLVHWPPPVQGWPLARLGLQVPAPQK